MSDYELAGRHDLVADRRPKSRFSRQGVIVVNTAVAVGPTGLHAVLESILLHSAGRMDLNGLEVGIEEVYVQEDNVWRAVLWVPCKTVSARGLTFEQAGLIPRGIMNAYSHNIVSACRHARLRINRPNPPYKLAILGTPT